MKRKNKQARQNGRFAKQVNPQPKPETDNDFILAVKDELFSGYFDQERIKKAFSLITKSQDVSNMALMRRTIVNYSNN